MGFSAYMHIYLQIISVCIDEVIVALAFWTLLLGVDLNGFSCTRVLLFSRSFPVVADGRSPQVWTKAAPGLLSPSFTQSLTDEHTNMWSSRLQFYLKPNMFTKGTFMYTTMWAELAKLELYVSFSDHKRHQDEPVWSVVWWLLHLYKNCRLLAQGSATGWVFWFLLSICNTWLLHFSLSFFFFFFEWKPFCTLSNFILSGFDCVFLHMASNFSFVGV